MKQSLRHQKIIEIVKLKGYASTEELVIELEVSPQTIRRDLNILAEQDLIRRHHGGAAPSSTAENSDYIERKQFFPSQKSAIAREVVKRIPNCIQSLKMRNKETNRDLAEFFGNKWDGFR